MHLTTQNRDLIFFRTVGLLSAHKKLIVLITDKLVWKYIVAACPNVAEKKCFFFVETIVTDVPIYPEFFVRL